MGFGLLFVGYALNYIVSFAGYGYIFRLAGVLLMAWGLKGLCEYNKKFICPAAGSAVLILVGLLDLWRDGGARISLSLPGWVAGSGEIAGNIRLLADLFFNISLLLVIAGFAGRLGLDKQKNMASRNLIFVGGYGVLQLLGSFALSGSAVYSRYFALPTLLIQLAWITLDLILIFSCYMYIAPEGDEDMPRRKSGVKFIDNILEESDRRRDKATRDTTEYYSDKIKSKRGKKNNGKK